MKKKIAENFEFQKWATDKIKFVQVRLKLILAFLAFEFQRPGRQKIHKCHKKSIDGILFSCGAPCSDP